MTKPNLGKKHTCKACEARFFDMNKNPAVCPKCGEAIKIAKPKAKRAAVPAPEGDTSEAAKAPSVETPKATDTEGAAEKDEDVELEALEGDDEVDDLEAELEDDQDDDDLMEDTSDMGEDNDDMSEVLEHVDDGIADK